MKLSPHVIIETIRMMGARHPTWRAPQALPGLMALLHKAVLFDFGAVAPAMEHKEFALDLYERKLFGLPFSCTAFSFSGIPHPNKAIASQREAGGLMVLHQKEDATICAVMCSEQRDEHGRTIGGIPIGVIMDAKLSDPKDGAVNVTETTYPVVSDELMALMYGDAGEAGHNLMRQRLCSNLIGCMGMTVMLMSQGVSTQRFEAPAKLNKARAAKGKPRINDRYVVSITAGDARMISTADGEESIAGHQRGTPRMHWRRGHFRTIYRDTERERVVPVAPALIGANETAEPIRQKAYVVRRNPAYAQRETTG